MHKLDDKAAIEIVHFLVVSEFMSKHERIPESESQDEDMKMLENIRAEMLRDTTLEDQHIPLTYLEWAKSVYYEYS